VPTSTLLAIVVPIVLVVLIATLLAVRSRRDRATEPVRLGPSWSPPGASSTPLADPRDDDRVPVLVEQTGCEPSTVATVLVAWDEYLAVLGLLDLPANHRWLVYDPYDPPVAERRDGRPVADRVRVARDVSTRAGVSEADARTTLAALLEDPDDGEPADARSA
jgi:hypothetical protein